MKTNILLIIMLNNSKLINIYIYIYIYIIYKILAQNNIIIMLGENNF